MKLKKKILLAATMFSATAIAFSVASMAKGAKGVKETLAESVAMTTDYSDFYVGETQIEYGSNYINYTQGTWGGNYAGTGQFKSSVGYYSFKTHVFVDGWTQPTSGDNGVGFVLYVNEQYHITFYLKYDSADYTCFAEGVWRCMSNSALSYKSALLPDGDFVQRYEWTDVWSDGTNWKTSLTGGGINLRTSSYILPSAGFDMTLHVERTLYKGSKVDICYVQIDAYTDSTKETSLTVYSPRYAIDALRNSNAETAGVSETAPRVGFMSYSNASVKLSDIVFSYDAEEAANNFETNYMHMTDVPTTEKGSGECISEGWYDDAKEIWNSLDSSVREDFKTNHADAYARLKAWAVANGEAINESNDYVLETNDVHSLSSSINGNYSVEIIIITSALVVSFALFSALFIAKKRKTN